MRPGIIKINSEKIIAGIGKDIGANGFETNFGHAFHKIIQMYIVNHETAQIVENTIADKGKPE
jgi:hypothetical protein